MLTGLPPEAVYVCAAGLSTSRTSGVPVTSVFRIADADSGTAVKPGRQHVRVIYACISTVSDAIQEFARDCSAGAE
jgi:hypothetical protein